MVLVLTPLLRLIYIYMYGQILSVTNIHHLLASCVVLFYFGQCFPLSRSSIIRHRFIHTFTYTIHLQVLWLSSSLPLLHNHFLGKKCLCKSASLVSNCKVIHRKWQRPWLYVNATGASLEILEIFSAASGGNFIYDSISPDSGADLYIFTGTDWFLRCYDSKLKPEAVR